jgi:PAS domain S-box-containing protein
MGALSALSRADRVRYAVAATIVAAAVLVSVSSLTPAPVTLTVLLALAAIVLAVPFTAIAGRADRQRHTLQALAQLSAFHEQILNSAGEGICQIDARGRTRFVNPAAARLLGWTPEALIDRPVHAVLHGETAIDEEICPIHAALVEGEYYHVKDDTFRTQDGDSVPVEYICTPITTAGEVAGAVITFQDIGERRDVERAIVQARDAAIESARLKSEFLANVSHEIRTPLNGIIGMTGVLLESPLDSAQRRQAEIVESSGAALLAIINDILDFSRIESGKLRFEEVDFDLLAVVDDTLESFSGRAHAKDLRFGSTIGADVATALRGDPGRLRQVLTNLLGNALKFTERGEVMLRARTVAERASHVTVQIEISDTGIGIASAVQARLFQPFMQADGSTTRQYGGTGLGLAISKSLVEQMAGAIGVESESGRGSRFWFTATFAKQAADRRTPAERRRQAGMQAFSLETEHAIVAAALAGTIDRPGAGERTSTLASAPPAALPSASLSVPHAVPPQAGRAPRLLVVEDNVINQRVAVEQLRKLGYAADAVANGREALEAVALIRYDAVLMDCQMPGLDGYAATRELRRREGAEHHTPVIAVTAYAMPADRQKCLDAGMDDYVAKPVLIEELDRVLRKYLPGAAPGASPATPLTMRHGL